VRGVWRNQVSGPADRRQWNGVARGIDQFRIVIAEQERRMPALTIARSREKSAPEAERTFAFGDGFSGLAAVASRVSAAQRRTELVRCGAEGDATARALAHC
jgi:hypothetical protein